MPFGLEPSPLSPASSPRYPRAVWLLGWVSLATDAATEAIYPLLPFFASVFSDVRPRRRRDVSGVVEGAAEAVSSVLKIASGRTADRSRSKRPLVLFGYSLSSIAWPFIAITATWPQVFAIRVLDRVGKGLRSAPRDAMLASWATPATRGRVYGFHRAMDHLGAVVGPTLASIFLFFYPEHYRTLFALTIVPGAIAVTLIFFVPEQAQSVQPVRWREAHPATPMPRDFTAFMIVLALFTFGNSTDAFLLLKLTDVAGTVKWIPLMWAGLHVVKAGISVVGGSWSDRVGRRTVIGIGWVVYAAVYAGFAASGSLPALLSWFLVYGVYFGFAEGTEKALVADLAPADRRGFAFGIYNAVQGLGALAASVLFGLIWQLSGARAAFGTGGARAGRDGALVPLPHAV